MKIGASDMKKAIEEIYKKLDSVTPVDFDCGSLCGEACCVYAYIELCSEDCAAGCERAYAGVRY